MKDELLDSFLNFTDKYGLNPNLLGAFIVLLILVLKSRRLLEQKKEEGKIKAYEYPPLILGIIVFVALLIFAF